MCGRAGCAGEQNNKTPLARGEEKDLISAGRTIPESDHHRRGGTKGGTPPVRQGEREEERKGKERKGKERKGKERKHT